MLSIKTLKTITAVLLSTVAIGLYNPTSALANNQVSKTNSVVVTPKKQTRKTFNVFKKLTHPKQSRISR